MADVQKWSISYTDVSNKKTVESFDSKGEAQSRYEALIPRTYGDLGDLIEVTAPVQSAMKVQEAARKIRWNDLGYVVRMYLTGFYPTASYGDYRVDDHNPKLKAVFVDDTDGTALFAINDNYNREDRGIVKVINLGLSPKEFDRVFDVVKRSSKSTANALGINPDRYPIDVVKADKDEDCGGASAASLGATPTGVVRQDDTSRKDEGVDFSKYQKDIDTTISAVDGAIGKKYDDLRKDIPSYWKLPSVQLARPIADGYKILKFVPTHIIPETHTMISVYMDADNIIKYIVGDITSDKDLKTIQHLEAGDTALIRKLYGDKTHRSEANKKEYNVYVGQYELLITDKVLGKPYGFIDTVPLYDNLEDDLLADYPSATIVYDQDIKDDVIANVYPWLEGDENTGSVQFADFSNDVAESKNESENPISKIYGDGGINTYQHSADGFFAERTHPIGFAILTNDTDALSHLYHCDAVPPRDADQYIGWSEVEDDDGNYDGYEYNWNDGYEKEFIDDWQRVIGETPNEDALKLMLSYDPDFFVCPADFSNALHAGYDKDILKKLFYNVRALREDDDDLRINYFGDSDYVSADSPDPIANIEAFLGASESCKSEALPPKPWNGKTRKFPSRAALVKKAKELRATEIGDFDDYTKKNKDLFLDKIGFAMDINGNSVARLWWGENDGKYYYSTSRDVLDKTV